MLPQDLITKHAPEVRIHPDEEYFPMDPMDFIKVARFRHHLASKKDRGWNKHSKKWLQTNSHHTNYYDIPLDTVTKYKLHQNGKNRRPRDKNRGKQYNVFLQSRDKLKGSKSPSNSIPIFFYLKKRKSVYFKTSVWHLSYWFFYGYNDGWGKRGNHQGDWEHITLVFNRNKKLHGIYMAAHGKPKYYKKSDLKFNHSHPITYAAKGSHASYPKVGTFGPIGVDKTKDGGVKWKTWHYCLPLKDQPWRQFAGAWGEVGTASSSTGPLGPWQKRRRL